MADELENEVSQETESGIPYKMQFYGYSEQWSRNANQIVAVLKVAGKDAAAFRNEILGWTEWDGTSTKLTRHLPLVCPYTANGSELYCESAELIKYGFRPNSIRENFADPWYSNWLNFDDEDEEGNSQCWTKYLCVFRRPTYNTLYDDDAINVLGGEADRYTTIVTKVHAREQKFSSYQIQAGTQALSEPFFLPDYNIVIEATWHQVPVEAVPLERWTIMIGTVNDEDYEFRISSKRSLVFEGERIRFRGPRDDLMAYQGGDGRMYVDPCLVFEVKGGQKPGPGTIGATWNSYRLADGTYAALTIRDTDPPRPVHTPTNFQNIFVPGNT